ncbi:tail terminator [Caulobacter phage CcrBL9]|uniref:Uncharacterized protein n=1 Tax=Caulobacter phage CcrBL9 TaxID=2283270 RepID=A0A385EBX0_9CAUD|nr:tail terminator [Caulobacter phage CcrBL9]AXQ69186.1 hypothetical protein CcrBL9_gp162 [Caulobacter phage CcrBL9]
MADETFAFEELRKRFLTEAIQAANTAGLGDVFKTPGFPFVQPQAQPWVEFSYEVGKTFPASLGAGEDLDAPDYTVGIFQFDVYVPEDSGTGPGTILGEKLRKQVNRKEWLVGDVGHVKLGAFSTQPVNTTMKGWNCICVRGSYGFWHRG